MRSFTWFRTLLSFFGLAAIHKKPSPIMPIREAVHHARIHTRIKRKTKMHKHKNKTLLGASKKLYRAVKGYYHEPY